jgi:hypothetical protein
LPDIVYKYDCKKGNMSPLAKYLKLLRTRRNLTELEISESVQIDLELYHQIENAPEEVPARYLVSIFKFLKLTNEEYLEFFSIARLFTSQSRRLHSPYSAHFPQRMIRMIRPLENSAGVYQVKWEKIRKLLGKKRHRMDLRTLQLPPLHKFIVFGDPNSTFFTHFVAIAEKLAGHMSKVEGVNVTAIHDHERERLAKVFAKLSLEKQEKKLQRFMDYYEHCRDLVTQGISLRNKPKALKVFKEKLGFRFPSEEEIFRVLDDQTFIEIYDLDFIQCYRSIDFFRVTNHSLMALEACEWWELFERSSEIHQQIMNAVQLIYSGLAQEAIFSPVDTHTVKEISSQTPPRYSQTEVVLYSPVYDDQGVFQGGLHFFKVREGSEADFKAVP